MKLLPNRRRFLAEVGGGTLLATLGPALASELGLDSGDLTKEDSHALDFGAWEPLVRFMQETPLAALQGALAAKLKEGASLQTLIAAGALANARTFGGEDYVGFHTLMALSPALKMSGSMPDGQQALPVFKVLYRNTERIQGFGGRAAEVLHPVLPCLEGGQADAAALLDAVRRKDLAAAESLFATLAQQGDQAAFDALLHTVQENTEVHRTVLPYRAWDLLDVVGREHAHTLLRQSVRYCLNAENHRSEGWEKHGKLLAQLLEEYGLLGKEPGDRAADDSFVEQLSQTIFGGTPEEAAGAVAEALAAGFDPMAVGEAISLATNELVLRDRGRPPEGESPGKPVGSVHGDSIGVHASDSANAWRNMARASRGRNLYACLILGAWQAAVDRTQRGGDFENWAPLPVEWQLQRIKAKELPALLHELDQAVRQNLQATAGTLVHRCGELGHPPAPVFELLLRYAVSEDGALHAEKYFQTVWEEFHATRPAFRWRHLTALARVTASEYGRPAAGQAEARDLLGISLA